MLGFWERLSRAKASRGPIALFLPGAGVNNATTAGMLAAFESAGGLGEIDLIVGTSAGSFSAAYFIGGAAIEGAAGYWKVLPEFVQRGKFFSPWRALAGRAMLDVPAVLDEVFSRTNPIPWERVVASRCNLAGAFAIQALDAESGEVVLLRRFQSVRALKSAITGSCWLPLLAGLRAYSVPPRELEEMEVADAALRPLRKDRLLLFDGSVGDYYMCGVRAGLRPRLSVYLDPLPHDEQRMPMSLFGAGFEALEAIAAHILFWRYPNGIETYISHVLGGQRIAQADALAQRTASGSGDVIVVSPSRSAGLGRTGARPAEYRDAVMAGWMAACDLLGMDAAAKPASWGREASPPSAAPSRSAGPLSMQT